MRATEPNCAQYAPCDVLDQVTVTSTTSPSSLPPSSPSPSVQTTDPVSSTTATTTTEYLDFQALRDYMATLPGFLQSDYRDKNILGPTNPGNGF